VHRVHETIKQLCRENPTCDFLTFQTSVRCRKKTSNRRRSRITCVFIERIQKSRRNFNRNLCDLFTAI